MTELNEKALKLARDAFRKGCGIEIYFPDEGTLDDFERERYGAFKSAISAYLSALPEQEPVGYIPSRPNLPDGLDWSHMRTCRTPYFDTPVYLASPVAHEEIERLKAEAAQSHAAWQVCNDARNASRLRAEAAEAKLAALQPDLDAGEQSPKLRVTGFRGNPLRVVLSSGDEATISQKLIDSFSSPSPFGQHADDIAVDRFAATMKEKLAKKRADGAGGWDDPEGCHIDYLAHLLSEQIHSRAALDLVDIGNYAMMIFNRGETPSHGR